MTYEYQRVEAPADGLRLHLNENTAGCSPKVLEALRSVTREQAAFYPDYQQPVEACAAWLRIDPDELLLTNGLDEGIFAAAITMLRRAAAGPPPEALIVVPSFEMYAACAEVAGGRVVEVAAGPEGEFPGNALLDAVGPNTRLVFLTNPHNPTGRTIELNLILAIAAAAPGALVFVDEAYADFSGQTLIGTPGLASLPNLVVGRTFAKAHGLAALRVGALVGNPRTLEPLRRAVPPYSLNVCAAVGLCAALSDREYYEWYLAQVRTSKALLYEALERLAVKHWRSDANFVLVDFGARAKDVIAGLAVRGIYIRDRSRDPGCPGCARITTGVVEHTRACIRALEEVLCGAA